MSSRIASRLAATRSTVAAPSRVSSGCLRTAQRAPSRAFSRHSSMQAQPGKERDVFNPLDKIAQARAHQAEIAYYKRRMRFAAMGVAGSFLGMVLTVYMFPLEPKPTQLDSPASSPPFPDSTPTVVSSNVDLVETGTSTIPHFPRTITLPTKESTKTPALPSGIGDNDSEYSLLGLGVRTVSFLSIQVYVVGIYVANTDLTALQAAFVKEAASTESASTLIAGEKESLREKLMDPVEGEKIWEQVLQKSNARTVVRIVPTRNTDFAHLRDGFERGINTRVKARPAMAEDETFGESLQHFKSMFGRGKLAKGEIMLLERGREGELKAWLQGKKEGDYTEMGTTKDERISRLMWLGYLGGKSVASEACRRSVIDGVMAAVERPIGTAETQVI